MIYLFSLRGNFEREHSVKKIYLASLREIRKHKFNSIIIIVVLVFVGSFSIAFQNITPNLEETIEANEDEYKLAHLSIFFYNPVDIGTSNFIVQSLSESLSVKKEEMSIDYRNYVVTKFRTRGEGSLEAGRWVRINLFSLLNNTKPSVNQFELEGRMPTERFEIALDHSYASKDGVEINDIISFYGPNGRVRFIVVGLINSIEFASYEINQISYGYITQEGIIEKFNYSSIINIARIIFIFIWK